MTKTDYFHKACFRTSQVSRNVLCAHMLYVNFSISQVDCINKDIKGISLKRRENIRKKDDGQGRSVLNNKFSSVILNELAMKARERYCNFNISAI